MKFKAPMFRPTLKLLALFFLLHSVFGLHLEAQPYFTNSASPFFGAQQYNQSLPAPYNPSYVLQRQVNEGILAGSFNTGTYNGSSGFGLTNTYAAQFVQSTNFSTTPAVFFQPLTGTNTSTTGLGYVLWATPTNFALWFNQSSNVNYSLLVIGH